MLPVHGSRPLHPRGQLRQEEQGPAGHHWAQEGYGLGEKVCSTTTIYPMLSLFISLIRPSNFFIYLAIYLYLLIFVLAFHHKDQFKFLLLLL